MPKFAVYYVPQANDPFYHLGTSILGYDVRSRVPAVLPPDLQEVLEPFDPNWTLTSRPYGFHLTITDALFCNWATLPQVERELTNLLRCFDPTHPFTLHQRPERPVTIWGETGQHSLVLVYQPNEYLRMLHTLLIARINPLAQGSTFLQSHLTNPNQFPPHQAQQIQLFYSPTILDNWYPHFTLLNPYTGPDPALMASHLAELFKPHVQLTMQTVCLLVQMNDGENWHIYREFHRSLL